MKHPQTEAEREEMIEGYARVIIEKVAEQALAGDYVSLRLLRRMEPRAREMGLDWLVELCEAKWRGALQ